MGARSPGRPPSGRGRGTARVRYIAWSTSNGSAPATRTSARGREAAPAIAAADAFVRPTRADGDALSVREALALGTPVVATAVGHRPPGCLLVDAADAEALAAAMARAAASPRGAGIAPGPDPLDALHAIYRTLAAPNPLADGGRPGERAPTF